MCFLGHMPWAGTRQHQAVLRRLRGIGQQLAGAVDKLYGEFVDATELESTKQEMQELLQSNDVDVLRALCLQGVYFDTDILHSASIGCDASVRMVHSLRSHALPLTFASYLDHMCQRPQEFVRCNMVMEQMWSATDLERMRPPPETEEDPLAMEHETTVA